MNDDIFSRDKATCSVDTQVQHGVRPWKDIAEDALHLLQEARAVYPDVNSSSQSPSESSLIQRMDLLIEDARRAGFVVVLPSERVSLRVLRGQEAVVTKIEPSATGDIVHLSFRDSEIYQFDLFQLGKLPTGGPSFSGSLCEGKVLLDGKCLKKLGDALPKLPLDQQNWWHESGRLQK